jgi:hypothetical protein
MDLCMPTEDFDASTPQIDSNPEPRPGAKNTHPAPSMVWMLLPIALLALLAFLSR